ncbi:hypothetical protein MTR67_044734 [Solanum verrucosum]|uniref:Uncharacterized protein n=1 Tax=Solanum verrucosum TaxID=315347 RepID=A0AAF0ZWC3_SOLVR|nr:hypothetical protein MTR67_044734 [Solanum verrucosum]
MSSASYAYKWRTPTLIVPPISTDQKRLSLATCGNQCETLLNRSINKSIIAASLVPVPDFPSKKDLYAYLCRQPLMIGAGRKELPPPFASLVIRTRNFWVGNEEYVSPSKQMVEK